jgi:hypothetical protein
MTKNRLEAFSDGVFAIIIAIMVLELKDLAWHRLGIAQLGHLRVRQLCDELRLHRNLLGITTIIFFRS